MASDADGAATPSGQPPTPSARSSAPWLAVAAVATVLVSIALGVGLGVGLQSRVTPSAASTPAFTTETLILKQAVPRIVVVNVPGSTNTTSAVGDVMYFAGSLTTTDGVASGFLVGSHTTVVTVAESAALFPAVKDAAGSDTRITLASFRLFSGEQIDVTATSLFPGGIGSQFSKKKIYLRTIVGGTGRYAGVTGEVATRREEDGSFTHALAMLLPTTKLSASSLLTAAAPVGP